MNRILFFLVVGLIPILLAAQNPNGVYNPYVDGATISPAPLIPSELEGKGMLSFNMGNKGNDPLSAYTDQHIILTITLSYGIPENEDPLEAINGSFAGHFTWDYNALTRTYSAHQIADIPANTDGSISIDFQVVKNSSSPGINGFNVNITPAPYQMTSNDQSDDAVSSYTYTEAASSVGFKEESLFSVYPNPSKGEFIIDFKEISGSHVLELVAPNGSIVKKDVIEFKGEPVTQVLVDYVPGLYFIHLHNSSSSYKKELILE